MMEDFEKTFENERIICYFRKGYDDNFDTKEYKGKNVIKIMMLRDPNEFRQYNTMIVCNNTN